MLYHLDFVPGKFNVTIPAGETSVLLNISIINDNVIEENESFNLTINSSHAICEILSDCILTLTIVDNDGKLLHHNAECLFTTLF